MVRASILIADTGGATRANRSLSAIAVGDARVYLLVAVTIVATMGSMAWSGLSLVGPDFAVLAVAACLLVPIAWCLRARGWRGTATLIETWTLMTGFSVVVSVLLFALAAMRMPLVDAWLAASDRLLLPWFDWPVAIRALAVHPWPVKIATACYASLRWQPVLLLVVCAATGRTARCWIFTTAWMIALIVTATLCAVLPAVGPYPHFGIDQAAMPAMIDPAPWHTPGLVHRLRDGSLRALAFTDLDGIVTFPSFHTVAAVLLAWGFRPIGRLGPPMVALNAGMMAAAVPIGGHYIVDSLAGIAVATIAILVARRWSAEHAGEDRVDVLEMIIEVEARRDLVRG